MIKQTGQKGRYRYFYRGKQLDLNNTEQLVKLINTQNFSQGDIKPHQTVSAALNLSLRRAEAVKSSLVGFAKKQNVNLDETQIQPTGAGIAEPIIPKPTSLAEAKVNMRVEFRIVRVPAEALNASDFDF